jgi:hypothetical protein
MRLDDFFIEYATREILAISTVRNAFIFITAFPNFAVPLTRSLLAF